MQTEAAIAPDLEPNSAQHGNDKVAVEPFDPASLPSIEAITVDTDIRAFLGSRVPADLTRAALRQAWASDPAVRDFIGIAESQWDFNDPGAIPGFGLLRETDNLPVLLEQALGSCGKLAETLAQMPVSVEQELSAVMDHESADPDRSAPRTLDGSPAIDADLRTTPDDSREDGAAIRRDRSAEEDEFPPNRRLHGSALPR